MDWTSIITTLISSGAFLGIFLIAEKKTASILDSVDKRSQSAVESAEKLCERYSSLADEYQQQWTLTRSQLDEREAEMMNQVKMNSSLRHELDDAHTLQAVSEMRRCDVLKCVNREPPFGMNADIITKSLRDKKANKAATKQQSNEA